MVVKNIKLLTRSGISSPPSFGRGTHAEQWMKIEVCVDNIESLHIAIEAGADRIELCSALALGGLTPSLGLIRRAVAVSSVPIYVMIRPRDGDFIFSDEEVGFMAEEIRHYKALGVDGVVVGALNCDATINERALKVWTEAADGLGITFHRAFDWVADPARALQVLIEHNVERVLTSGQEPTAIQGKDMIAQLVRLAKGDLSVMAGSGVAASNARQLAYTGVKEIHLSGKTQRPSRMVVRATSVPMGTDSQGQSVSVTDYHKIEKLVSLFANE